MRVRHICTSNAIRTLHGEILSGSLILPHALSVKGESHQLPAIVQHFCATVEYQPGKWSESAKDRVYHPEWQRRHDYLDAGAYARAVLREWENKARAEAPPPAPAPIGGDFVQIAPMSEGDSWATSY